MTAYNTPYDDVFRTLLTDCKELIIPVINEVFDEHYDGKNQKIQLLQNEIFIRQQNGEECKKITDSLFVLKNNDVEKKYHLECQSVADGSMIVRMFEYDAQIALLNREVDGNILNVNFPNSAILYLRHTQNTPNWYEVVINAPSGSLKYRVPTMKAKEYNIDEIFEKQLFFLIPFYIFSFESSLNTINQNEDKLMALQNKYADIVRRLDEATQTKVIDEYTNKTICEMTNKVVEHIASKYNNIIKEVSEVMGGRILEYEAKDILNKGRAEGRAEGHAAGILDTLLSLVKKGLLTVDDAAEQADMDVSDFVRHMNQE